MYFISSFLKENSNNIRLFTVFVVTALLFILLGRKLYDIQIMQGEYYSNEVNVTTVREVTVEAKRGGIYDRYGRTLAENKYAYTVYIDPSAVGENANSTLEEFILMLSKNGEAFAEQLPITRSIPRVFLFDGSPTREKRWKEDMDLDPVLSADECYNTLIRRFEIDPSMDSNMAFSVLSLRSSLYTKRYSRYLTIPVAYNVSEETVSVLKEQSSKFPFAKVEMQSLRYYPYGKYLSHIVGYTGNITDTELEKYEEGTYDMNDVIGKDGIEKAFEANLKGEKGTEVIEVDSMLRRVSTVSEGGVAAKSGQNVQLTIDAELQKKVYDELENALRKEQVNRLTDAKNYAYTTKDVFVSMIKSDNIRIRNILNSYDSTVQGEIKKYILSREPQALTDTEKAREALLYGYETGPISSAQLMLALFEQGQITNKDGVIDRLKNNEISGNTALMLKLSPEGGEITPQMTSMDPCTGSVVITDIYSGDVLAAVSYPSYDNNLLVNNFNSEYYLRLQNDPLTPMVNRPFTEPRAPGSIFKMITAVAGIKEGVINPSTIIKDLGTFTDAGLPYAKCWIAASGVTHGDINLAHALEVSCNYYFYTVAYSLGEKSGTSTKGIDTLNKYMQDFGLDSPTGVEIYELYDSMDEYPSHISSPAYKEYVTLQRDPNATSKEYTWTAGDTIRTAIGQSYNNYTCATIAKYIATLANGGTRYSLHLMKRIINSDSATVERYVPNIESSIDIDKESLKAIYEGMHLVTKGEKGTLKKQFENYDIDIAAKSGTAQQSTSRSEHTTFVAFAPYNTPQISIAVCIPFGNGDTSPAAMVAQKSISAYLKEPVEREKREYNTLIK
ncbi:MAG: hypothetical protein IJS61_03150 [Firmicutes bacterium]|nr:hypothetical protein [Bacillota bacterium]